MNGTIYFHRNLVNDKIYVGQTRVKLYVRNSQHRHAARKGKRHPFFHAIRKYGWDNFEHGILSSNVATQEALDTLERFWIIALGSNVRGSGYNLDNGGSGVGRLGQEHIRILNGSKKGKPISLLHRQRISEGLKGHRTWNKGIKLSEAHKQALRDGQRKRIRVLINDGLNRWQRYRLKNLEAYRARKRAYVRTPEQREHRRLYGLKWREKNRESYNAYCRERRQKKIL